MSKDLNRNVLITGVAGLFGVNMSRYLLKNKSEFNINMVYGVDDLSGGYYDFLPEDESFQFIKGDLTDKVFQKKLEEQLFKLHKIDYIFHFQAYAAEGLSTFIRQFNYSSNLISTAFLVNMGIIYNIKRFIFTSSMAVYGENTLPFSEELQPKPVDPYGIAKYACEMDIKCAYESHGLEYCIIRPHNVYGKYQNIWDPYRNVLGIWMYKSKKGDPITVYGDGNQTRAFSYINDTIPCLWNAAIYEKAKNQIINVGGKREISLNEASELVSEVTGNKNIVHLEERVEVKHAWATFEKSEKLLDFKESVTLKEGIKLMWEWVKYTKSQNVKYWDSYEINKKMYSYWQLKN